ncbi:MAG: hypothetical protein WC707_05835 [Candidatus Babeliaceae bacterium]|jgi:histo-blood group ABO system transferase
MENNHNFFLLCAAIFFTAHTSHNYAARQPDKPPQKIALCIMATGKYIEFAENLISSARSFFCRKHHVTYFVFTDGILKNKKDDIVTVYQKRLGWPQDTLMRFHTYYRARDLLEPFDYIFAIDADMQFADSINDEILSPLVATIHPGYRHHRGPYECDNISQAYVSDKEGTHYFAGGFYGGRRQEFFKLLETVIHNVDTDLARNYIAVWHDESHLNRYFIDNEPTVKLPIIYCWPENWKITERKKIIALSKNHAEARA